jgi:hypothetical protein
MWIIEAKAVCEAMLGTRRHPCTHILPILFDLPQGRESSFPVILNSLPNSLITILETEWLIFVGHAVRIYYVLYGVCVVGRLYD